MKKILYFLLAAGLIGAAIGYSMWNKPHKDMQKAATDITVDATAIFNEYEIDENAANAKYFEKVIAIKGVVKESSTSEDGSVKVSLDTGKDFGVLCVLSETATHARKSFTTGETVTLKGSCAGLNFDVQFVDCVEVK